MSAPVTHRPVRRSRAAGRSRALLIAIALLLMAGVGVAAAPLTAHDCIDAALQHSFLLKQNRHLLAADRADITKKRGTTLPYLSGSVTGYELWGNPVYPYTIVGQPSPENGTFAARNGHVIIPKANFVPIGIEQVGVSYPILSEGSLLGLNDPPTVATAVAVMSQQELTTLIAEQQVIQAVLTEYVDGVSYRDQVAAQEQIVALDERQLAIIQAQVAGGAKLPYQAATASAQLASARQALDGSRDSLQAALNQLGSLMGLKDQPAALAEAKLPLLPLPPLGPLLDQVMKVHPALHVQEATVEVAHQQLRVDRAGRLPNVMFNSSLGTGQDLEYFNGSSTHTRPVQFATSLTIAIPLYDFGQRHAAMTESDEKLQAARDGTRQLEMTLRGSMKQTYSDLLADSETLANAQSLYARDTGALAYAQAQHAVGEIDELALVVAQLAVLNERVAIVMDQMAQLLKYAELQNLSGGTWRWLQ